jgi:hypothetical protein
LLLNPTLSDLVGGIESVTLSDEEARRRGTQKTVLERRSPPTFDVLIEIQTRDSLAVHHDVAEAVDSLLRGYPIPPESRYRDASGAIKVEKPQPLARTTFGGQGFRKREPVENGRGRNGGPSSRFEPAAPRIEVRELEAAQIGKPMRIFPFGVARNRLLQAAKRLAVPVIVAKNVEEADVLLTLRSYFRKRQRPIIEAENQGISIFVLRSNTVNQMQQFLSDLFNLPEHRQEERTVEPALIETQAAINAVLNGERYIELPPATSYVRRLQHQMARKANLTSHSYGKEPSRRVRIFRD